MKSNSGGDDSERLAARYRTLSTQQLVDIWQEGGLTEEARACLVDELSKRGEDVDTHRTISRPNVAIIVDPSQIRPWIRFWARMFDYLLVTLVMVLLMDLLGIGLGAVQTGSNSTFLLPLWLVAAAWIFIETVLLAIVGTTPGKALLNITLSTSTGDKLTMMEAFRRSIDVFLRGMCAGLPLFNLIANYISYNNLIKTGATHWDVQGEFRVTHGEINKGIVAGAFVLIMLLFMWMVRPNVF